MAYIRHRSRMVRESVLEYIRAILEELDWTGDSTLAMLSSGVLVEDYFPVEAVYQGEDIALNTLAIDQGTPSEPEYVELGGEDRRQTYTFNFAFFAESDGVALALFSDLADKFLGMYPGASEGIPLFNYLVATPTFVTNMEVTSFEVAKSPQQPAPGRLLWFAQLTISDYLELD